VGKGGVRKRSEGKGTGISTNKSYGSTPLRFMYIIKTACIVLIQEKMSEPSADMICGRPSSCRASTIIVAPSGEQVCIYIIRDDDGDTDCSAVFFDLDL